MKGGAECRVCCDKDEERFRILDEAHRVRAFQLVLCVEVPGSMVECTMGILKRRVDAHKSNGEFGSLLSGLSIIYGRPPI